MGLHPHLRHLLLPSRNLAPFGLWARLLELGAQRQHRLRRLVLGPANLPRRGHGDLLPQRLLRLRQGPGHQRPQADRPPLPQDPLLHRPGRYSPNYSEILFLLIPFIHSDYFLNYLQLVPAVLLYIKKAKNEREILGMLQYHRTFRNVIELSILGCDVMLIGNYAACIFVGLDLLLWRLQYYGNNSQYYWLSNDSAYSEDLIGGPWILQYVFAQSFATGTLSTLAPGPFGKNPIEIVKIPITFSFTQLLS